MPASPTVVLSSRGEREGHLFIAPSTRPTWTGVAVVVGRGVLLGSSRCSPPPRRVPTGGHPPTGTCGDGMSDRASVVKPPGAGWRRAQGGTIVVVGRRDRSRDLEPLKPEGNDREVVTPPTRLRTARSPLIALAVGVLLLVGGVHLDRRTGWSGCRNAGGASRGRPSCAPHHRGDARRARSGPAEEGLGNPMERPDVRLDASAEGHPSVDDISSEAWPTP